MSQPLRRKVVVLGATGSIGTQTLDIIRANADAFDVIGLSAGGGNVALLAELAIEFNVAYIALAQATVAQDLQLALYAKASQMGYATGNYELPKLFIGPDAASQLAAVECDVVVNGITGAVGLQPTVAALKAGTTLALANKESLVIGGVAVTSLAKPGQIVPVDSEHSALAQCLRSGSAGEVRKLILTASGGPFRGKSRVELADVTVDQALAHPTWTMGPVVTINSSTMMNKGLEIIEAHLLFDIPMDRIEVVVHPQSIVHSMVEFVDGSTIAQVSPPDMHLPIALGLTWPGRLPDSTTPVDWQQASTWTFEPVDEEVFPAVALARRVGTAAGTAPAVMNAANEIAVAEFLQNRLGYLEIVQLVTQVVDEHLRDGFVADDVLTLEAVVQAAQWAHEFAQSLVHARA
jgi:1-deoxy-D-xylulose-5-phosphate reductoisomerase